MGEVRIWCFADGGPNGWEAFCPDFDISVQGDTFEEVKATLNEAINTYVQDAMAESPRAAAQLLRRRAPAFLRLKYALRLLAHAFRSNRSDGDLRAGFDVLCHA
jgi:predicted RNase H-like HicB family nuclease